MQLNGDWFLMKNLVAHSRNTVENIESIFEYLGMNKLMQVAFGLINMSCNSSTVGGACPAPNLSVFRNRPTVYIL